MKYNYQPKSQLEKSGLKIYNLLVENFPQTFFVGGMVRDVLLERPVMDIDLATVAKPDQVIELLQKNGFRYLDQGKNFGVIKAVVHKRQVEIATFRRDSYLGSRYPKINFITSAENDSNRRDFTINSLYLSPKLSKIYDFQKGLEDLKAKLVRFIGQPEKKIKEDPLRILRALRFALDLNFFLEPRTFSALKKNFLLLGRLSQKKKSAEIKKVEKKINRARLKKILGDSQRLDNFFLLS